MGWEFSSGKQTPPDDGFMGRLPEEKIGKLVLEESGVR